jgi:hypothetical protein
MPEYITSDAFEELQPGKRHGMYIQEFVISVPTLTLHRLEKREEVSGFTGFLV